MAQETVSAAQAATSPIRFRLSQDRMRAYLDLLGPPPDPIPGLEAFAEAWQASGLEPALLNPEKVLEAADAWKRSGPQTDIPVGESPRRPVPGQDGRLELLVDLEPEGESRGNDAGGARLDLRKVRSICAVEKGQPLARRHPPGKGEPGTDMQGQEIPAPDGQDIALPSGELVLPDPADPQVLVAGASGYVEWDKGRLAVRECYVVNGAVDYASGNVDYARNVMVQGDVQDGFSVRAGGDLKVGGSVGDAEIVAGGAVHIAGGFVGGGKGMLNAKGSVEVGFVSNQTLRAYGPVTVAKEVFNARLSTKDVLLVNGALVGGSALAGLKMQCKVLGNELGTRTEVELGVDYLDAGNRAALDRKIRELSDALQKLRLRTARIKEAFQKTRRLPPEEARLLLEFRRKIAEIEKALPALETRKVDMEDRIRKGYLRKGIELKVENRLYPGVMIKVDNQVLRIPEEVAGPRLFSYSDNRIHMY